MYCCKFAAEFIGGGGGGQTHRASVILCGFWPIHVHAKFCEKRRGKRRKKEEKKKEKEGKRRERRRML